MARNNIFNIPVSPILNKLNYWITTNSKNISYNYLPIGNLLSLNIDNKSLVYINLNTDEVKLDITANEKVAFFVSSKEKIYVNKKNIREIFSDFDTLGIITNYNRLNIKKLRETISTSYNKSSMLNSIASKTNGEVVIIHRNKFYMLHEICFLKSDMREIDYYISYMVSKLKDFSDNDIWKIKTVLYEVFDNAVEHGSNFNTSKLLKAEVMISSNGFYIEVSDQGKGFNLDVLNEMPNIEKKTGRGLLMIRRLSDILAIKNRGTTVEVFVPRSDAFQIRAIM